MKCYSGAVLLLIYGVLSPAGQAGMNMSFTGTLIDPPPCTIKNSKDDAIDVDFGDRVGINKVNGENYLQSMNYQITCESGANDKGISLEIVGTPADYDRAAVVTDITDLAIQIKQNGVPFTLNKPLPISILSKPRLEAVPVKRQGAKLTAGPFEATATLKVVYQ
ncbi:fimbrial protein [Erwinia persicina]|uniref:fimbrial protein n=1 Tax=Erwinia persicina TaxID=55211 RepID=UPI001653FF7E|nr:fimbrial protein [Erwinia persicina]MBC3946743.1 fimbrial protein [Erwinia persicina]